MMVFFCFLKKSKKPHVCRLSACEYRSKYAAKSHPKPTDIHKALDGNPLSISPELRFSYLAHMSPYVGDPIF